MTHHFAETDFLSGRALAVGGILALHVLAAYVLATGMLHQVLRDENTPLISSFLPDEHPAPPAPVPERVDLSSARIDSLPAPQLPARDPEIAQPAAVVPLNPDAGSSGSAALPVAPPLQIIGHNQLPDTQAYYPAGAIRDNIEGAALVRVCVDAQGVRHADPVIEQSSGNAQLDQSALNVARHGRYARALQGGTPVPNCYQFRINFRITH